MNNKKPKIIDVNTLSPEERNIHFHQMAEDSRTLELLLHTCFNNGITPVLASKGHGKNTLSYIILTLDKKHLNTIGRLIDLVEEIPNTEFNIRSNNSEDLYAELFCDCKDSEQLFTRVKEIVEEDILESASSHNLTLMNTIYNIAKIVCTITEANILFATNESLYSQGKCGVSFYKEGQSVKISKKKAIDIEKVIRTLKETATLNLPTVFFCSFEELRTFYFELDEVVYGQE